MTARTADRIANAVAAASLLLVIPVIASLSLANGVYATTALVDRPGSLPFGIWSAWLDRWLLPVMFSSFIYIFLLYPDGHLPSRRWRPVLGFAVSATAITARSFALRSTALLVWGTTVTGRVPLTAGSAS